MDLPLESVRLRERPAVATTPPPDAAPRALGAGRFAAVWVCATTLLGVAWAINPALPGGRVVYVALLFALAVAPTFLSRSNTSRLLAFFMLWYGTIFGIGDAVGILFGPTESSLQFLAAYDLSSDLLNKADLVIYLGGITFIAGYLLLCRAMPAESRFLAREWNAPVVFWGAVGLWIPTTVLSTAYYLSVDPGATATHIFSIPLNIVSNLRIFPMIASAMLIYLALRGYRSHRIWSILFFIIVFELVLGFFANTKEVSFRVPAMLVVGSYFVRGRLEFKWIVLILVCFVPYHLLFDIYRQQYLQVRSNTTMEAVRDLGNVGEFLTSRAERQSEQKKGPGVVESSMRSLSDRVYARKYVDIIVARTGVDVPYQGGTTLAYVIYSFVPRAIWTGKPQISTGQLFNEQFQLSQSKLTFVPSTFLGELYWNLGVPAVIVGMGLIGAVFGAVGRLQRSLERMTAPRFILLLMTTYFLVLRFEAGIGQQFGKMGRILIALLALHFVLSRLVRARSAGS